jgi:ketosteroid isomerase-like protein
MDEHPNLTVARRLWDAIAGAEIPALRALMSDKTTWRMPGDNPLTGVYVGADAVLRFMARVGDLSEDLHSDLIEIYVSERGAALHYGIHALRGTQRLDTEQFCVIRVEKGRITQAFFVNVDQVRYDRFFQLQ